MILSFYERRDSPWVWVQFAARPGEPRRYEKTTVRKDEKQKRQKLARLRAVIEERLAAEAEPEVLDSSGAWAWVSAWIGTRFAGRTQQVYRAHWRWLASFLYDRGLNSPMLLEREHCFEYVEWRKGQVKQRSGRTPKTNTAIGELKLLAQVLDEAIARHLIRENPARRLGIEREDTARKPEITDAELGTIFAALEHEPEWMRRAFLLALQTGLRFADTAITREQVDWPTRVIQIEKPKGGRRKAFAIPIYESIEPLLREWWQTGERAFWSLPEKERPLTGLAWTKFFRRIGLPHLCFHCTRVTFISRGARAGISEGMMMKLVNHASSEVHRVYQRLPPGDAARLVSLISIPQPPGATR